MAHHPLALVRMLLHFLFSLYILLFISLLFSTEDISSGEITTTSRPKSDAEKSHDDWLQEADYSCVTRSGSVPTPEVANASSTVSWADVGGEARLFVIYRCKWDFDFVGHSQHMYCQNGKWIGVLPECQPFCEFKSSVGHQNLFFLGIKFTQFDPQL